MSTGKDRWDALSITRSSIVDRGRYCSELTIPSVLPRDETETETQELNYPYQSVGAYGTNNVASKLLLALFPPNGSFFQLRIDDALLPVILEEIGGKEKLDDTIRSAQKIIANEFESEGMRVDLFQLLQLLVITGNGVLYIPDSGPVQVYNILNFAVKRDPSGRIVELVLRDQIAKSILPEEIVAELERDGSSNSEDDTVTMYSHLIRNGDIFEFTQWAEALQLTDKTRSYPADDLPWIVPRWTAINNENYSRGLTEEFLGDLRTLDGLMEAILDLAAAAARLIILVNPNGYTTVDDIMNAINGEAIEGREEDIGTLKVDKVNDLRIVAEIAKGVEARLSKAFLLNSSVSRDAERVTAEEIRFLAKELEDALGGVYSILSEELQKPLIKRIVKRLRKANKLPKDTPGMSYTIVTGFDALGKGHDLAALDAFIQRATTQPEYPLIVEQREIIYRIAEATGVDPVGLIKSLEDIMATKQQNMMANAVQGGQA